MKDLKEDRGLGKHSVNEGALAEARARVGEDGVGHLVEVRTLDFTNVDLVAEISAYKQASGVMIITAFQLPDALQRLRPQLQKLVEEAQVTLITFKWDFEGRWEGAQPGKKDVHAASQSTTLHLSRLSHNTQGKGVCFSRS